MARSPSPDELWRIPQESFYLDPETGNVVGVHEFEREEVRQFARSALTDVQRYPGGAEYTTVEQGRRSVFSQGVVNDAPDAFALENCALCSVAGALGIRASDVAKEFGSRNYQSAGVFCGTFPTGPAQRRGIEDFLVHARGRASVSPKSPDLTESACLAAMRTYPDGTRFVVDLKDHYVAAESFRGNIFFVDYQSNMSADAPPTYYLNKFPDAPYMDLEYRTHGSFWALVG